MIKINSLSFGYQTTTLLFDCINLELSKGKIHGLLGQNGEGKTSLLKLLIGLIKPKNGSVEVNEHKPFDRKPAFLSQVYLLPEETYLPASNARQIEKLYSPFYPAFDSDIFRNLLKEFDVEYYQNVDALSSGQRKKIAISFAFACNSSLLLLDEPTNGLDISSKAVFRRMVASMLHNDKTIIISTHQVHDVRSIIDNLVILHQNKIAFEGEIEDIALKYSFVQSATCPSDQYLFVEKSILGSTYILHNKGGKPGEVNIETFFKAVVEGKLN
jgi:ABC-2 type transport system ATP-binding protein